MQRAVASLRRSPSSPVRRIRQVTENPGRVIYASERLFGQPGISEVSDEHPAIPHEELVDLISLSSMKDSFARLMIQNPFDRSCSSHDLSKCFYNQGLHFPVKHGGSWCDTAVAKLSE